MKDRDEVRGAVGEPGTRSFDRGGATAPGGGPDLESVLPGVHELDHTADVGIEIEAPTLEALLERAAAGMWFLVFGDNEQVSNAAEPEAGEEQEEEREWRELRLEADGPDTLLLKWLQELLYLYEVDGFLARRFRFDHADDRALACRVGGGRPRHPPIRDLKGVTYHRLMANRVETGWEARVIFDV